MRRLTFNSASTLGLYDRGLLRPGMAADIMIFDPDTVQPLPECIVHDFPAGGWRYKEPAAGIYATFVNGRMLMKEGEHTGNLPGRVLRNSRYQAARGNRSTRLSPSLQASLRGGEDQGGGFAFRPPLNPQ